MLDVSVVAFTTSARLSARTIPISVVVPSVLMVLLLRWWVLVMVLVGLVMVKVVVPAFSTRLPATVSSSSSIIISPWCIVGVIEPVVPFAAGRAVPRIRLSTDRSRARAGVRGGAVAVAVHLARVCSRGECAVTVKEATFVCRPWFVSFVL